MYCALDKVNDFKWILILLLDGSLNIGENILSKKLVLGARLELARAVRPTGF